MKIFLAALRGPQFVQVLHLAVYRRGSLVALAAFVAGAIPLTGAVLTGRIEAALGMAILGVLTLALLPVATSQNA